MNTKIMLGLAATTVFVTVANAEEVAHPVLTTAKTVPQYGMATDSSVWKTAAGNTVAWVPDYNDGNAIAEMKHVGASASSFSNGKLFNAYGLVVNFSEYNTISRWQQTGEHLDIGAGGVDVKNGYFSFAYRDSSLRLTANQTWTGSNSEKETSVSIGVDQATQTKIVAMSGVDSWTIGGKLVLTLYSPDNELSGVDVTFSGSSRLQLADYEDARLNAKKLVFDGDGVRMDFGSVSTLGYWHYDDNKTYRVYPTNTVYIDKTHLAETVELKNGADISATAGVWGLTNIVVSGSGESVISGTLAFALQTNRISFADAGAVLSFETENSLDGVDSSCFEMEGAGTLKVRDTTAFSGTISLSEGQVFEIGGGDASALAFAGAGTVVIGSSATVYIRALQIADFTGSIVIKGGTLVLDESLGDRVTVESGEVLYGTDPLVVTDTVRTETELTVEEGTVLRVFGNGLTSATALKVNAGTVRFESSATIGSPLTITKDTSYIETAASYVTGSITGFITSDIPSDGREATSGIIGTATRGPGCIKLSGGGTWNKHRPNSFLTLDGSVWFCGGTYTFRNTSCGMSYTAKATGTWGRRWLVTDGAKVKVSGYNSDSYVTDLRVSGLEHSSVKTFSSTLEVRDGGEVEVAENAYIDLGYMQANGYLIVGNNGKVRVTDNRGNIRFGYSTTTTGIIDLRDGGLIETASPFMHSMQPNNRDYQTQGRFIWNGGTVKVLAAFPESEAALFRNHRRVNEDWTDVNGSLRTWVKIMGETCTLDLTDLPERETPLANVPAGLERSEWFGTGTLTVKGGKPFVMQSFPNGINLKVEGAGTQVILPENVEIHDYETCLETEEVNAGVIQYTTLDKCLQNMTLASFTAEGAAGSFVCHKPDCKVTIAEARAAAGGEFVNGMLSAVGGLEVGALAFAENSIVCGDPAAATLAVTGDITLPDALRYAVRKTRGYPTTFTAFTAGGALIGNPTTLTPEPGMNSRQVVIDPTAKTIGFTANGLILMVR